MGEHDDLTVDECRQLLATRTRGRVGLTSRALPVIVPVEYRYCDDTIVVHSDRDDGLRAAAAGDVLAFEIDAFDQESGCGWSVLVLGRATEVRVDDGVRLLHLVTPGSASSTGDFATRGGRQVRMRCELVSGHRLVSSTV